MGAWIEINCSLLCYGFFRVAPLVGAWIEIQGESMRIPGTRRVAPLVGAWIEICGRTEVGGMPLVAPLVGAWIEIYDVSLTNKSYASLLSWERGLKCISRRNTFEDRGRSSRGSVD